MCFVCLLSVLCMHGLNVHIVVVCNLARPGTNFTDHERSVCYLVALKRWASKFDEGRTENLHNQSCGYGGCAERREGYVNE
jgi:hypothetical protein